MARFAPPPEPETLREFPTTRFESGWRLHRREFPPEYYFRGPTRFTPARVPAVGALYLASTPADALAEVVAPGTVVSSAFFEDRVLTELDLSHITFADLRSRRSLSFGLSLEITTSADYTLGQEWASALSEAGFGGLAFPSGRVPGASLLVVFGYEGAATRLRIIRRDEITPEDLHTAGVTALAVPSSSSGLDPLT